MKGKRYTEQQMLDVLSQVEAGQPIGEVARTAGVAVTTIHRWKAHYGGMTKDETKRFRLLEEENRRLKRLVADLSLDREGAQRGGRKKVVSPEATPQSQTPIKRQVVGFIRQQFKLTERRACRVLGFWRSTQRHHRNSPGEE